MAVRRLLRGRVPRATLEAVAAEVATRAGGAHRSLRTLEADNWLSTPCVVDEEYFVKVITQQNALVHALLTTGRNLGVFSAGTPGFFDHVATPVEMAEREFWATSEMRNLGVNAPRPIEAFEFQGLGVLVLEYLPAFDTLDRVPAEQVADLAPSMFASLARMHAAELVHGDLRAENVLVADGELYFIDATTVRPEAIDDAAAYDLACALATLAPIVGARRATRAAVGAVSPDRLLAAESFLDFVNIRPDHDFDAAGLKGEIEKHAE